VDSIFSLQSAIQLQLRFKKCSAFGLFIDFKRAFDSLVQYLLWQKLYCFGVSARFIRILQSLYNKASFIIKLENEFSDPISVTEGVLQGEVLSPLLFILFISDFEKDLRNDNLEGINIDGHNDILTLLFADDAVVLARSPVILRKVLLSLEKYCNKNKLIVNTNKTQIMHFRKGGRSSTEKFTYKGQPITLVNTYSYLGITISSSSLGRRAADDAVKKGKIALGSVAQTISKFKTDSWDGRVKLFDSIISSTMLYAAEVWSLRYCENIEIVQSSYYKRALSLPKSTPNAALRLELGLVKLSYRVFKRAFDFVINVLQMEPSRYPKICLFRLVHLHLNENSTIELNWVSQFNALLQKISMTYLWNSLSAEDWINNKSLALDRFHRYLKFQDVLKVSNSGVLNCRILRSLEDQIAPYLLCREQFYMAKVIAQLRLSSKHHTRFCIKGVTYKLELDSLCTLCNLRVNETLEHFMFECPIYSAVRHHHLHRLINIFGHNNKNLILHCTDINIVKSVYFFIVSSLRLRAFLLNE